jgi:hypothetical protein
MTSLTLLNPPSHEKHLPPTKHIKTKKLKNLTERKKKKKYIYTTNNNKKKRKQA